MADKRFTDNPADNAPVSTDIIPGTDVSANQDKKYTFSTIGDFVKTYIGNATQILNGLMSATDKVKLDGYAAYNPGNDKALTTGATGLQVWIDKSSLGGDMSKSVYDTNDNGKVDVADASDAISGSPGANQVYVTNGAGVQGFLNISSIADMKKSDYDTGGTGNSVDLAILSNDSVAIGTRIAKKWAGLTTDAIKTEIFINGVSNSRLTIASGVTYAVTVQIMGVQDDLTDGAYFTRQVMIANTAGTTALIGAVQTVGTDINTASVTVPDLTADDANDSLKLEVNGKTAENWNWSASVILNQI